MVCEKCGSTLPEEARFCYNCGWQVPTPANDCQDSQEGTQKQSGRLLKCPKCGSENIQFSTSTERKGFSAGDSCCGYMLFGPLGLICGLSNMGETKSHDFWLCQNCGAKFQADDALNKQKERAEKLAQYNNILQDAPENLEAYQAQVHQEFLKVSEAFKEENQKLKMEQPQYARICRCTPIGGVMILAGIVLAFGTGSLYFALIALLGLVLILTAVDKESKLFDSMASPKLQAIKKQRDELLAEEQKLLKQIKAKKEKQRIEGNFHQGP